MGLKAFITEMNTHLRTNSPDQLLKQFRNMRDRAHYYERMQDIFFIEDCYWLSSHLKPNTTCIDLGANIGDSTIYFALNPNVEKVYAYEMMKKNYDEAVKNIGMSRPQIKSKIIINNAAVTDTDGSIYISQDQPFAAEQITRKGNMEIRTVSLDSILLGKKNIAIKCDIEGAEEIVFKQCNLENVYIAMIEYRMEKGINNSIIPSILDEQGFSFKIEDKHILAVKHPLWGFM